MQEAFEKICQWFESSDGSKSLRELQDFMRTVAGDEHTASLNWLKQKLLEKYNSNLHITTDGYRSIVTIREKLESIIKQAWFKGRCSNIDDEKQRIISLAAEIIRDEIHDLSECNKEYYPQEDNIANKDESENWLPKKLLRFLSILVPSTAKRISIGQSIVYAARPNYAFPPVLFGLGVELDHVFGSRWLVEHLSRLGFCISYQEVAKYKQSVLQNENTEDHIIMSQPRFARWSADDVDHNIITLDGKNTFHGMGVIISSIHQKDLLVPKLPPVQRRDRIPVEDLSHGYNIPIFQYRKTGTSGIKIKLKKVVELYIQYEILKEISSLNTLWHIGWLLNPSQGIHSNWAGYMQTIESRQTLPSASDVIPLPIIDTDSGI